MKLRLMDLPEMHPCLLWDDIVLAAAAVLRDLAPTVRHQLNLDIENVPPYESELLALEIVASGVPADALAKVRRTYEPHRLVELAAIAIAGMALFQAGGHQIRDVALRGSSADYLVDDAGHLLEVAGRSRRNDLAAAWQVRWNRLAARQESGFYVCVIEFETPAGRLAFAASDEGETA